MSGQALYAGLVMYSAILRLAELIISRQHQAVLLGNHYERQDSAHEFLPMVLLHVAFIAGLIFEPWLFPHAVPFMIRLCGIGAFAAAQMLRFSAMRALGMLWNVNVMSPGALSDGTGIVASGPYRFIRHPNYAAVILEFVALPLIGGAYMTALAGSIFNGLVLMRRIREEEKVLFEIPGYAEAMGGKGRLLPRLLPRLP